MKSFEDGYIENHKITQNLIKAIKTIGEFRGKQILYKEQSPQVLETLRQVSIIQSTESSNRIEGITAPIKRIKDIINEKTVPENRSEQEIAGYRDVLTTVHLNYENIPFTPNVVLQLHRDLYKYESGYGGKWKSADNEISETYPDGRKVIRFKPISASATPEAMDLLHLKFNEYFENETIEPLLLIPSYMLDFLCIHPFLDGNGRMARILTLLLLYKARYEVGRYISLEKVVEETKEGYYDSLYKSSQSWHEGAHSLIPIWEYFLGVMLQQAYKELENRVGLITEGKGAKTATVLDAINGMRGDFSIKEIQDLCPTVGIDLIRKILRNEKMDGRLECLGKGPNAKWRLVIK